MVSKLTFVLAAGILGGLMATAAAAMPVTDLASQSQSLVQDVRVVCNQWGRCYETRRYVRRYYDQPSYYYAPRAYRYSDAPGYGYYGGGPSVGFSFGFGNRGWW